MFVSVNEMQYTPINTKAKLSKGLHSLVSSHNSLEAILLIFLHQGGYASASLFYGCYLFC